MTVPAERTGPLSEMERMELVDMEMNIKKGLETFIVVGASLDRIRSLRLFREDFETYEDYCESRWGFKASRARQLIGAFRTVESLTSEVKPANEAQTRILNRVSVEQRDEVWTEIVKSNPDAPPTTAEIREAVERWEKKNGKAPEPEEEQEPETEVGTTEAEETQATEENTVVDAEFEVVEPEKAENNGPAEPEEPTEEDFGIDFAAEVERLEGEVERLRSLLDDLETPDEEQKAKLVRASERIAGLEGALNLANTQKAEAAKEARYAKNQLKKVRDALGVERDRDILKAIEGLQEELRVQSGF